MTEPVTVTTKDQLQPGEMKSFNLGDRTLVIAREDYKFYAADNKCPHMGGSLSKGMLEGHVITCPLHHSRFDLRDGKVLQWTDFDGIARAIGSAIKKPKPLKTYPVVIKGNEIQVILDP